VMLSDVERATLGEIGHRLGRRVLAEAATVARPDTILACYRKLVHLYRISSTSPSAPNRHSGPGSAPAAQAVQLDLTQ
jgi:putative transposase